MTSVKSECVKRACTGIAYTTAVPAPAAVDNQHTQGDSNTDVFKTIPYPANSGVFFPQVCACILNSWGVGG